MKEVTPAEAQQAIVEVEWQDSHFGEGWASATARIFPPVFSVGYVAYEDEHQIFLVRDVDMQISTLCPWGASLAIPRAAVVSIRYLKKPKVKP